MLLSRHTTLFTRRASSFVFSRLPEVTATRFTATSIHLACDELSEEEKMMRDMVRKFATEKIEPLVKKMDKQGYMEKSLLDSLFEIGLMGIEVPSEYGGTDSTFFACILAVEELARVDPSFAILVDIQNTLNVNLIKRFGTPEQRKQWLPRLAKDTISSFALSEPEAGSDAFSLRTVAKQDGSDFVLNGSKCWTSNSAEAGLFLLMANAIPEKKHRGITTFLIPRDTPGFTVGKMEDKVGLRASSTCTLHLDNVRLPKSAVLGEIGNGYKLAINMLNESRIGIAAQMTGLAQGCFDKTLDYVRQRRQFGRSIWDFQAMQHQIADMATQLHASRVLTYNTARKKERGYNVTKEASMAKYFSSEMATRMTSKCMEWMGGVGFTTDYPIEKFYRDIKIGCIYEGTSNIQLNTIAKYLDSELKKIDEDLYHGHD